MLKDFQVWSRTFLSKDQELFSQNMTVFNPLNAKFIKWSNTLKQIVGKLPIALKELTFAVVSKEKKTKEKFRDNRDHSILRHFFDILPVFFSTRVKWSVIISNKKCIYDLPHELPNDFKLASYKIRKFQENLKATRNYSLVPSLLF